jgi:hypothetical protein
MNPLVNYLQRRIDRPFAWILACGGVTAICGAVSGLQQGRIGGAVLLAIVGGGVGARVGAAFGVIVWLVCLQRWHPGESNMIAI